ncbi:MAG TPA: HEPN domain-containing protein [Acidimicrobiales bacterium]|jgi:HEPN domain-containing protein|nr:HEPN domain-containing protein [Acidimicrobiales bacterium]
MVDDTEFDRWRAEANEAIETARLAAGGGRFNWACFLAEQAAQLAVKGLLHGLGAGPWGHDLFELGNSLVTALDRPLPDDLGDAMRRLSQHYIPSRYPDAQPGGFPAERYTAEQADEALADAELVVAAVDDVWAQLRGAAG